MVVSELVSVGTMENQQHDAHGTARQFELNEWLLDEHPDSTGPQLLDRVVGAAASHLLAVIHRLPAAQFVETAKGLVLPSLAIEQAAVHKGLYEQKILNLGWLLPAKWALNQVASEAGLPGDVLETTWFFGSDYKLLQQLGSVVKGEIEPAGTYHRSAFAAGVAIGEIGRTPQDSPTLVEALIESQAA